MFSLNDKRATNRGFGDGMSRAFEIAATPVLFGAAGYGLDLWLGTGSALTLVLAAVAVAGTFVRMWFGYDAEMRQIESTGAWVKRARRESVDDDADADLWARRRGATGADT